MQSPIVDKQHIQLSYITHFYCNQENIDSVISLLAQYEKMDSELLKQIEFIIVDDCSPAKYSIPEFDLNITWLRINSDIQWNQGGARNLGVTYAKSDKIIITDLDHVLPEHTFKYLVKVKNPGRDFFKIYRMENNSIIKGHSNMFFMSRARFMRFFGYDEEFSGNYGAEDYRFVKFHKYHGSRQRYLPKPYYCTERNIDRKKSYHSLTRDLTANTPVDTKKHHEICKYGYEKGHSRTFLNFEWCIVKRIALPSPEMKKHPYWKYCWWLRYLFSFLSK
ncbi:glycosyltransferase family 2 protein [Enterobacter sp. Lyrl_3]|uniref:glycosyltransferase family 2 protein n=1 Tax=Enterobacter sp. Lyrl_3 TaxID=3110922 RepID=UPI003F7DF689